jgi:hypothetical protein
MTQSALEVPGTASAGERLLFAAERRSRGNGALNVPIIACVRRRIDKAAIRTAIEGVVRRHEALRTRLEWRRTRLVRVVSADWTPEITWVDLTANPDPAEALEQALRLELTSAILSDAWPVRVIFFTLAINHHVLCMNLPHRVTDAVTNRLLLSELATLYRQACGEAVEPLAPVQWKYSQWVEWQASLQDTAAADRSAERWKRQLEGAVGPQFPNVAPVCELTRRTGFEAARIDDDVIQQVLALAKEARATPFSIFLAALYATLHRCTRQTDLAVTTVFSDRNRRDVLSTAGYFVRILALRARFDGSGSFRELIDICRHTLFDALQYQMIPFQTLSGFDTDPAKARVDHVVMQMMDDPADFPLPFKLHNRRPDFGGGRTFDLELVVRPLYRMWHLHVLYGTDRFEAAFVRELVQDFLSIMRSAVSAPDTSIVELTNVSPD